ncbi:hypothetical protein CLI64_08115 [Nostoc sp. CENA543]|uniref:hypothetical protein n=1 Tax=Nostoc sp. CENA543 TaxID=1869241 RepID=UPI000CA27B1E|nr:hypothetical protein [Nostoc sp. CENA543]AUT00353.1 hypothetical protein CLI64_08115 [Nostoc sp. CENA543]
MLVNPQQKTTVCDIVVSVRLPKTDAELLETLVANAKAQGLVNSKASFIRYVLNDYVNRHADVLEVA